MQVRQLIDAFETIAPAKLAESWDNVGLLVGTPEDALAGPVLLAIDVTDAVLDEAIERRASGIVAYHPTIFHPLKRLSNATPKEHVILRAIRAGLAIYSPHTALDAATGGITDWLCEGLSGGEGQIQGDCRALVPSETCDSSQQVKLVTFVPPADVQRVRDALASSGAGMIGSYRVCSFSTVGHGTFFGGDDTSPAIGESGQFETVEEIKLEMVCSKRALPLAMEALHQFHPYETPAVDVFERMATPSRTVGPGRRLVLDQPVRLMDLADRMKAFLGIPVVKLAPAGDADTAISHIGVCPGAGASLAPTAREEGCSVFMTGEMRHHEVLENIEHGMSILLVGHTNSERPYLPRLADRLCVALPGVEFVVSERDVAPIGTV